MDHFGIFDRTDAVERCIRFFGSGHWHCGGRAARSGPCRHDCAAPTYHVFDILAGDGSDYDGRNLLWRYVRRLHDVDSAQFTG